jgi:hypothetical protein
MDDEVVEPLTVDELVEPLDPEEAKKLIRQIQAEGRTVFISHARERMSDRSMDSLDIANVLRAGTVDYPEDDNAQKKWRYRVRTDRMTVVVEFRSRTILVVVTAWRS